MRLNKSLALSEIDEAVWHSTNCENILKIMKQQIIIIFPVSQEEQSNMKAMCFLRSHETPSVRMLKSDLQKSPWLAVLEKRTLRNRRNHFAQRNRDKHEDYFLCIIVKKIHNIKFIILGIFKCTVRWVKYIHTVVQQVCRTFPPCKTETQDPQNSVQSSAHFLIEFVLLLLTWRSPLYKLCYRIYNLHFIP